MPYDKDFWHVDWDEEFSTEITESQLEAIDKVAKEVANRGLAAPVMMFLETVKPLNYIASQMMLFLEPFYAWVFGYRELIDLRRALNKRESITVLIGKIEQYECKRLDEIKQSRKSKLKKLWHKIRGNKDDQ
ncbi:hypothetical protein J7L68_06175 [bacterium]|nr:hypothetical protein [bacterium]